MKRDVLLMHERSVFRTPPDFTVLAEKHFDFAQHVSYNTQGKAKLDFKDADSQRALSRTLLKHFFNLDVQLPPGRLVPAVPQRLNYLLWVQDLVEKVLERRKGVTGLDIGTGASCVLALLGHRQCGWDFTATETDPVAFSHATQNVTRNDLQEHIKVMQVDSLVKAVEKEEAGNFDFCVCNPPFFTSAEEADAKTKAKEQGRASPPSDMGGTESEKVWANSGEVGFFKDVLLRDSLILRDKVGLYTCMLGKNSSVKEVLSALHGKVKSCRVAEFHQGKTTRYAIAWTFRDVNLLKVPYAKVRQQKHPTKILVELPPSQIPVVPRVQYVWRELLNALSFIEVPFEIINEGQNMCHLLVKAKENTWTHLRRRRREIQRKRRMEEEASKAKAADMKSEDQQTATAEPAANEPQAQEEESSSGVANTADTSTAEGPMETSAPSNASEGAAEPETLTEHPVDASDEPPQQQHSQEMAEHSSELSGEEGKSLAECTLPTQSSEAAPVVPPQEEGEAVSSSEPSPQVESPPPTTESLNHTSQSDVVAAPSSSEPSPADQEAPQDETEAMDADMQSKKEDGQEAGSLKRKQMDEETADGPPSKVPRQDGNGAPEENSDDLLAAEGLAGADPTPEGTPLILCTDVRVRRIHTNVAIHMTVRSGQSDVAHQLMQYIKNSLWGV
ncbi:RNA N(6)-adenosine-methyltransferase mettl16-like [Amblyomma americanum]|uniref:U6 small nuclear RNA (adenine-(43)-N(6))-methyltransferase n=1 Tax=Amblyomma americanum TaxID=6943 RepID=A0AAQ4ED24_AMBAM